ncbi:hypothetical protein [Xylocopilactobacillus apicola]|uniref:DUF4367 domain-containing protein n=1 Tax=Xylocopilactobacillus apicola TaxID=2932184 RepID=A0AAU9DVY1_9LACO|nr:hypothetical protein [Xylocopilactobacillus apicola]BDR59633.1 hypothetical protein XA3_20740 [Xylocopilactobacillus apicola]
MARLYSNDRTGTHHTYQFYKDRKDDPHWRESYLAVRSIRRWENILTMLIIAIIAVVCYALFSDRLSPIVNPSKEEPSTPDLVKKAIIGHGFQISAKLFDGEDATQAMNSGVAPQNLFHDRTKILYFKDANTVTVKGVPRYFFPHDEKYEVSNQAITIDWGEKTPIPFLIKNNQIEFQTWTSSYDNHTVTWQIEPRDDVQELIEEGLKAQEEADNSQN